MFQIYLYFLDKNAKKKKKKLKFWSNEINLVLLVCNLKLLNFINGSNQSFCYHPVNVMDGLHLIAC